MSARREYYSSSLANISFWLRSSVFFLFVYFSNTVYHWQLVLLTDIKIHAFQDLRSYYHLNSWEQNISVQCPEADGAAPTVEDVANYIAL